MSPLEGRWTTGPIPIADIKSAMLSAGITASDVDAWVIEVGSPTEFSFELQFRGDTFTHAEETPAMPMQVGESGSFTLSGSQLLLTLPHPDNTDTYTLDATLAGENLTLHFVDSTEQGTAEAKANHRRYTIAFYCAATFTRQN